MKEIMTSEKITKHGRNPLIIEEVYSEKVAIPVKAEKRTIHTKVPLPEGHVRVIVLKEFEGIKCYHHEGDIIDLPDRRFKSLILRGYVREYKGFKEPGER